MTIKCCYKCTDREIECHPKCPKYIKESTHNEEIRKLIAKNKNKEYIMYRRRNYK